MSSWEVIREALPSLFAGALTTMEITCISLTIAMFIGLGVGLLRISTRRVLRFIAMFYVDIIRGTPLLVQVLFIYIGLPSVLGIHLSEFTAGVIAISINAGAYLVEIFRAGITSVDKGQMEAGRSLGFSYAQTMRLIILPQAVRTMTPAFVNQFIISLKDTSLLSVIGVTELLMQGQSIYSVNFRAFEIISTVAVFYLAIIYVLTLLSRWLERRMAIG
ncbi:MAG TPA: amino acid ABC transporter permease [Desulfobacteria bacterium]|nr:amino acid ABC transporter permease [Desulfobacteria bacterium]